MNVSDVKSKSVPITLQDGKERHLRFTLNALAELEDRYGSVEEAFKKVEGGTSIKALRTVIWAGLIWEDPDITEQDVGNLIDIAYMQEMIEALGGAFEADMPQTDSNAPAKLPAGSDSPNLQ